MILNRLFGSVARMALRDFERRNTFIERVYIRHSASFSPQDPFLSDLDVTFFVRSRDLSELLAMRSQLAQALARTRVLRFFVNFLMVFPATESAYDLCKKYYPYRSVYPFKTWRIVDGSRAPQKPIFDASPPLDQVPEKFIRLYLLPVIKGDRPPHSREHAFLARKVEQEAALLGQKAPQRRNTDLFGALLSMIELWDGFYRGFQVSVAGEPLIFKGGPEFDCQDIRDRLSSDNGILRVSGVVSSIWAYPDWLNEKAPHVSVNLDLRISEKECRAAVKAVVGLLKGAKCSLMFGSEAAMVGRINGLAGFNLFEPWLFGKHGHCLSGDLGLKSRIQMPSREMLEQKYKEIMLYFVYNVMHRPRYKYGFYKACFILDHLARTNEVVLNGRDLSRIYGAEFIPRNKFDPVLHTAALIDALKKRHDFSLF